MIGAAARVAMVGGLAKKAGARQQAKKSKLDAETSAHKKRPTAPGSLTDERVTQLKMLAELRDAGVLTQKEFATKKAKLLP